jgi:hypothetical protein
MMIARCATSCGIVSMGLPLSQAASPFYGTCPASAGLFLAGPPRSAQPTVRLGVEVVGLLRFGGTVRALYGKTQRWTHLAPSPLAGLLFVCAASERRPQKPMRQHVV